MSQPQSVQIFQAAGYVMKNSDNKDEEVICSNVPPSNVTLPDAAGPTVAIRGYVQRAASGYVREGER
tara:strand:- start:207 stop:407 length:201 start_codon:yes stop_codon:yes gene_type:complete